MLSGTDLRHDLRETLVSLGDVTLNVMMCGDDTRPVVVFLHGFPEYSAMWAPVMTRLAERCFCVAPDQRGYNLSSRPAGVASYSTSKIAGDACALIRKLSPRRPVVLVGHDWGAAIAYAVAMGRPDLVDRLIVINGVHPGPFQRALLEDGDQIAASQYFHTLRAPTAESRLSAGNFDGLLRLFGEFSATRWMTRRIRQGYLGAWSQPGALTGMLNWYRASPVHVPRLGEDVSGLENPFADPRRFRVKQRHLLIWGQRDKALRPASTRGLEAYCDDLTRIDLGDADHWAPHTHSDRIAAEIERFLAP